MRTLLAQRDEDRRARRLQIWEQVRRDLRRILCDLMPGERVMVFGSLTRRGVFHDRSDVDLGLFSEPASMSVFALQARLTEALGRPVDIVLLDECRFRAKIESEGEQWTL